MPSFFRVLLFTALTFLAWGLYGPVLHIGQAHLGHDGWQALRAFICVGVAYFLAAVLMPTGVLVARGEKGKWTASGFLWSFLAGALGALGAFGVILALVCGGRPVYVMPLVFGSAPVINTLVSAIMARSFREASFLFYLGILVVIIGAVGVLTFRPSRAPHGESAAEVTALTDPVSDTSDTTALDGTALTESTAEPSEIALATGDDGSVATVADPDRNAAPRAVDRFMLIPLSIALAGFCWGAYGPVLHKGQMKMAGSRLRPFFCVGLAYFVVAVVLPGLILSTAATEPPGDALDRADVILAQGETTWTTQGTIWALAGGLAGAIGAIGIIMAFTFGGKPVFVMPLVFGLAPVVNTFFSLLEAGQLSQLDDWRFWASLGVLVLGAISVLVLAPKPHAAAPPPMGGEVPPTPGDYSRTAVSESRESVSRSSVPTQSSKQAGADRPSSRSDKRGDSTDRPPTRSAADEFLDRTRK